MLQNGVAPFRDLGHIRIMPVFRTLRVKNRWLRFVWVCLLCIGAVVLLVLLSYQFNSKTPPKTPIHEKEHGFHRPHPADIDRSSFVGLVLYAYGNRNTGHDPVGAGDCFSPHQPCQLLSAVRTVWPEYLFYS